MIRKLLTILVSVTLIVLGYGYFFDAPPADPAPTLEEVLPPEMNAALQAKIREQTKSKSTPSPAKETSEQITAQENSELLTEVYGNGKNRITLNAINHTAQPLTASIKIGDIYENNANRMIALENQEVIVPPGAATPITFNAAALRSANQLEDKAYRKSLQTAPRLQPLVSYLQQQTSLPPLAVLQTATLMLAENQPLRTFAKFQIVGEPPSLFAGTNPTKAYKVDTTTIIAALILLQDAGVNLATLDAPQHPQLKTEALVGKKSHAAATKFYHLNHETEWQFWKDTLINGNPQTRHYALYAIGRYYPDVAIIMMPDWARNTHLQAPYRIAALYALAMTKNPQTTDTLLALSTEFPTGSKIQIAADKAYRYRRQQQRQ